MVCLLFLLGAFTQDDAPELPPPPEPEVVYHEELEDKIRDAEDDEFATAGAEDAGEDA